MGDQMRSAPEMMKALENFHIQARFKLFVMIIVHQRCKKKRKDFCICYTHWPMLISVLKDGEVCQIVNFGTFVTSLVSRLEQNCILRMRSS